MGAALLPTFSPFRCSLPVWSSFRIFKQTYFLAGQNFFIREANMSAAVNGDAGSLRKNMICIGDEFGFDIDLFAIPGQYEGDLSKVLVPNGMITDRVEKVAKDIWYDYAVQSDGDVLALCVLKGGHQFFAKLKDQVATINMFSKQALRIQEEFVRIRSYKNDSSGELELLDPEYLKNVEGRNVLVVEDIVDTGRTIERLLKEIAARNPKSVRVASLLLKRCPISSGYVPDYTCFEVPDHFVVGFGLDYNEIFRDLNHICIISEQGKAKYSVA